MNDNGNALSNFNKAIQISPDFSGAYVNRAMVKINLAFKTKIVAGSFSIQNRNINARFDIPVLRKETMNKDNLEAALSDCNKAIQVDSKNANAWQVRAAIKLLLGEGDYCYDLLKAEQLGSSQATQMIAENKCR
jgi:Tfp pilus assembly protein PilF